MTLTDKINQILQKHSCLKQDDLVREALLKSLIDAVRERDKEAGQATANHICKLIDDIELSYRNTSMEEWKAFKRIRNKIRDTYELKPNKPT